MSWFGLGSDKSDPMSELLAPALKMQVDRLEKHKGGVGKSMLKYVATGEPISALGDIANLSTSIVVFKLSGYNNQRDADDRRVYEILDKLPPAVTLRYAKVLAAAAAKQFANRWGGLRFDLSAQAPWPEVMIYHATGHSVDSYSNSYHFPKLLDHPCFEGMLVEDGLPAHALLVSAFNSDVKNYGAADHLLSVRRMGGFESAVVRHAEALRPVFRAKAHEQRLHVLQMLEKVPTTSLAPFAAELAASATDSSKQVRQVAQALVRKLGADALPALKHIAESGDPTQRSTALQAIWDVARKDEIEAAFAYVRGRKDAEKTRSVIETIEDLDARAAATAAPSALAIPDLPTVDFDTKAPDAARQAFDRTIAGINKTLATAIERAKKEKYLPQNIELISSSQADLYWKFIAGHSKDQPKSQKAFDQHWIMHNAAEELTRFAATPGLSPVHLVRAFKLLISGGFRMRGNGDMLHGSLVEALNNFHQTHGKPSLLELQVLLKEFGVGPEAIARSYMGSPWILRLGKDWHPGEIWPFFAKNMDILRSWLTSGAQANDYWFNRTAVFDAVGTFPEPPGEFVELMFDIALGTAKTDRLMAQEALATYPEKEKRIVAALTERKAETRTVAATWLGRLRYKEAVPAIEAALAKENNDVAIGAMMSALELLDVPVDKFLNRSNLEKDAIKGLGKGIPASLAWFPWDALPDVHWADSGEIVPRDVMKWFLVQAVKLKSPEPHAVLRRYASLFVLREREAFGQTVLDLWLREDVKPIAREEAEKQALSSAQGMHSYMTSHPQYFKDSPLLGKSVEQIYASYLPSYLRQPAGSANDSKGVLAVAAACCGADAAPVAQRYLKEWYGTRAAQGKALIAMLAWIEHPSATQLMLSVGNRFRTKSFQEEATRQAELLAERKGWTLAELADRTIPSAGFDENGEMELDYGERKFTARLDGDFKVGLVNADGKTIASLPEPRKDEDETRAKDAKKAFSTAKKEIKSVVQMQSDRLYEALCTQRAWRFEDWNLYLNRHAIVRRLLQRLVWAEFRDGKVAATFRPLDDGSLTDVNDDEVSLPADAAVGVAHDSNLSADEVKAWQAHLVDYKIAPLFQQFGKGNYALPAGKADLTAIDDFQGHLLETFALRGRATKLGYQRGAPQDGGWFFEYQKRFPTLGLVANIEFTGNGLPEENRTIALTTLTFARATDNQAYTSSAMKLKDVPQVLLSECYNDMRLIAAEGKGFDPEWEKKSQY